MALKKYVKHAKRVYKGGKSAIALAKAAYKGFKYIKGLVNAEKKYYDKIINLTPNWNGAIVHLSDIAQGDSNNARNGNSILLRSIYLDLSISIGGGATNSQVRIALIMDTMQTGTPPLVNDIYEYVGSVNNVNSPLNIDKAGRYKVLKDMRCSLNNVGLSTTFRRSYKKLYHHVKFTGASGADEYKNNLWLVVLTNESTATPTVTGVTRLGFYDN